VALPRQEKIMLILWLDVISDIIVVLGVVIFTIWLLQNWNVLKRDD